MDKEFLTYEQALALKELGFKEYCMAVYPGNSELQFYLLRKDRFVNDKSSWVTAPLYQQAFRWFRQKYGWQHSIDATSDQHSFELGYNYWIWNYKTGEEYHTMPKNRPSGDWEYKTYEEAELACLIKLIEIVKNK